MTANGRAQHQLQLGLMHAYSEGNITPTFACQHMMSKRVQTLGRAEGTLRATWEVPRPSHHLTATRPRDVEGITDVTWGGGGGGGLKLIAA